MLSEEEEEAIYEISDNDFVVVSYRTFKALHNKVHVAPLATFVQTRKNFKSLKDSHLKAKARIWP